VRSNNPVVMPGYRIRLLDMPDDPNPLETGSLGIVQSIVPLAGNCFQIHVEWDNGRTLSLISPVDRFELLDNVDPNV